jgi:hypothetical protein
MLASVVGQFLKRTAIPNTKKGVLNTCIEIEARRWKRLEEEIEVPKSFNHPYVIRVIDSGYTKGSGYPFLCDALLFRRITPKRQSTIH